MVEEILQNLKDYLYKFERNYSDAIRYEKMGLSSEYKTTKQLIEEHKESCFNEENGLKNYIEHIENKINLITSLYEITSSLR